MINGSAAEAAGVGLGRFHTLLNTISQVRNVTTVCLATGAIPGALLGAIAGYRWAKRKARMV